jgi:hypothetical protein
MNVHGHVPPCATASVRSQVRCITASRLLLTLLTLLSVPCVAWRSEAQRLAPVALRVSDRAPIASMPAYASMMLRRDTVPVADITFSPVGTVLGGISFGLIGTVAGFFAGLAIPIGCRGECGLESGVPGAALGEAVGVAVGAHLGSRSPHHGNIVLTSLASAAILVGGIRLSAAMPREAGITVPLTLAMQLAAAWAIESR